LLGAGCISWSIDVGQDTTNLFMQLEAHPMARDLWKAFRTRKPKKHQREQGRRFRPDVEALERRDLLSVFTPGDIVVLRSGDPTNVATYNGMAPLYLDEYNISGVNPVLVQSIQMPIVPGGDGAAGNNNTPFTIDQGQAAGNGQLNRTNDGSALTFGANDVLPSTINGNGNTETQFGSADRNWAIVTGSQSALISSGSESGTTVTITTTAAESFATGQLVTINGLAAGYNGNFAITGTPTSTTFTYTAASGLSANVNANTSTISSASESGNTVTIQTQANHNFVTGQQVNISGVGTSGYNGTFLITGTPSANQFTYTAPTTGLATDTNGGTANGSLADTLLIDTTTHGQFFVGDDNRGAVSLTAAAPLYTFGHPNAAGQTVSQGVYDVKHLGAVSPSNSADAVQVSAGVNIRGATIGFDGRLYWSTAGATGAPAGIYTESAALPTTSTGSDVPVVLDPFAASKVGGVWLADMDGNGILSDGDRLYWADDGTVGGAGTGGLYVSTYKNSNPGNHWGTPVLLGDTPLQASDVSGQMRNVTGTVLSSTEALIYVTAFDNTAGATTGVYSFDDKGTVDDVVASPNGTATTGGTTVTVNTVQTNGFTAGEQVTLAGNTVGYYNGVFTIASTPSPTSFTFTSAVGPNITGASESGTTVTITTQTAYGYASGTMVTIGGVGNGYDGTFQITAVDAFHFTYTASSGLTSPVTPTPGTATATIPGGGGTVSLFNPNFTPTTIITLNEGTATVAGKNVGAEGIRGVSFVPVAATSISLGSSSLNPTPGTNITLTANVSNPQVAPTGTIVFIDDTTNSVLGTGTITSGVATFTTSTPLSGLHNIHAYFAGGGIYNLAPSRSNQIQVIEAGTTTSTTVLTADATSVAIGRPVTLTATVSGNSGTPTGNVTFVQDGASLGTVTLSGGVATLVDTFTTPNTASVTSAAEAANLTTITTPFAHGFSTGQTVTISGSSTSTFNGTFTISGVPTSTTFTYINPNLGANISTISESVNTVTVVTTAPNPFATGNSVTIAGFKGSASNYNGTFTVTVTNSTTFTYTDTTAGLPNTTGPATATIKVTGTGGTAVTTLDALSANYNGDATYAISSGSLTPTVTANAIAVITSSANNVALNATPTYTVTMLGNTFLGFPAGTVQFFLDGTALGSAQTLTQVGSTTNSTATVTSTALSTPGSHFVTVQFTPNSSPAYAGFTLNTVNSTNGVPLIENVQQAFKPGDLVAIRRGDGSFNLGSSATLIFLDELKPDGTLVQSIALPIADSGNTHILALSGQAGTEGMLSRSANGYFLTLIGFDTPLGTPFITSSLAGTFGRTVGLVGVNGSSAIDTSTLLSGASSNGRIPDEPLGAVSNDGQEFWVASALPAGDISDSGISYVNKVGATDVIQLGPNSTDARDIGIANGQVYATSLSKQGSVVVPISTASEASTTVTITTAVPNGFANNANVAIGSVGAGYNGTFQITVVNATTFTYTAAVSGLASTTGGTAATGTAQAGGVFQVGSGLSTSLSTLTSLSGLANAYNTAFPGGAGHTKPDPYQFVLLNHTDGTTINPDLLYIADQTNGLLKFSFDGTNWNYQSQKLVFAGGVTGVSAYVNGSGQFQIYVTGSNTQGINANQFDSFLDKAAFNAPMTGGNFTFLSWAGAGTNANLNTTFSGMTFAPAATTTTTLTSSAATTTFGNNVTYTAHVASSQDTPAGSVTFLDGNTVLKTVALSSGAASFTTTTPPALGSHTIRAVYNPGGTSLPVDGTSTGTLTQTFNYTPGDLVVTLVGTGSALTSSATASSLQDYTGSTLNSGNTVALPVASAAATVSTASWATGTINTATITTTAAHNFQVGQSVTITGVVPSGYNGTFTIASVPSTTTFTYALATNPGPYTSGGSAAVPPALTEGGTTTTEGYLTDAADGHSLGIAGYNQAPGGSTSSVTRTVGVVGTNGAVNTTTQAPSSTGSTRVAVSADGLGFWVATSTGVRYVAFGASATAVAIAASPNGATESGNTVTITTSAAHGFAVGQQVTIASVGVSGYNGTFTIQTVPSSTTFTYADAASSLAASGGGTATPITTQITAEVSSPTAVAIGSANPTSSLAVPGQLFGSAGAGAQSNGVPALDSPYTVGSNLPTSGGNAIAVSPSFPTPRDAFGNFPSTNQFAISPDGNTIFIADSRTDSVGGILEYFQSTQDNWTLLGSLQLNSVGISTASESGTTVTITTSSAHGFSTGQTVTIAGVSVAGYNTSSAVTVTNSTTFTYSLQSPGLANGNGGFATLTDGGLRAVVADFSGVNPVLYATTTGASANRLVKITGGTTNGNTPSFSFTTLATAPANEAFRGVALAPTAPGTTGTTTTLAVANNSNPYGTGVTLTATVTNGATGWVSYRLNNASGAEIGAAPVVSGTAIFFTAGNLFASGSAYSVVAVYTGDGTFAPSTSASQSVTVTKASTTTALSVAINPIATGVSDTLTATLGGIPAGTTPTGIVTFTDTTTSTTLGTGTISQVIVNQLGNPVIKFLATINTTFSTTGTHSLSAVYSGDINFTNPTAGTSNVLVVNPTVTTVTTSAGNPTASPPTTVTLTATMSSPGGTPTGTVEFFDDLLPVGVGTLNGSGVATATVNTALLQSAGAATITNAAETGNTVTITTSAANGFVVGQVVTIAGIATAGYNGSFTIASIVDATDFTYADPTSGLATDNAGGTATVDVLTGGLHSISGVYTPDTSGANTFYTSTGVYEQTVQGKVFTAGDQFVYRVGDGVTSLNAQAPNPIAGSGSIGSTIYVDEYNPAGTLIQSIILPSADSQVFNISTATESGNTVTITTTNPHNFFVGEQVLIAGVSVAGYNGAFVVATVPSSTTFTYTDATGSLANATGGTATDNDVHAVVGNGQQSATGQMSLSGDGQFLFVAGYDNNPLNAATALPVPTASGNSAVPRSIARIKWDGTVQTIAFTAGSSGVESAFGNFNGVYSPDGNQFYLSGGVGVYYSSSFTPTAALQTPKLITNIGYTTVGLEGSAGNLYAAGTPYTGASLVGQFGVYPTSGSVSITAASESSTTVTITTGAAHGFQTGEFILISGVTPAGYNGTFQITVTDATHFTYTDTAGLAGGTAFGTAIPTLGLLPGLPSTDNFQQFPIDVFLTHLNGASAPAGVNTMYISDDGPSFANGRITKWTLNSGSWSLTDTVTAGTGNTATSFYFLSGNTDSNGNVLLYTTYGNGGNADTGPGALYSITDTNGWNAPIGTGGAHSDAVTTVASVGSTSNKVFRGTAAAPLPAVRSVTVNANTFPILSATESSTTVTITTNGPHGFILGQTVAIQGVSVAGYNGVQIITGIPDASDFTYTAASGLATATHTGTASEAQANTASISTATSSGTTATITTTAAHNFTVGQIVTVAGVSVTGYNGSFAIASIPDSTHFTYTTSGSNLANGTGGTGTLNSPLAGAQRSMVDSIAYKFNQAVTLGAGAFTLSVHGSVVISTATSSGTTATITTATPHGFTAGQQVVVAGVSVAGYNGTFTIVSILDATDFTYTTAGSNLANGTGGLASPNGGTVPTVSYLSPDGGFTWILTFSGTGVTGNSIADGVYDIQLNQAAVVYNNSGATLTQSNRVLDTFWREYGDFTGAKTVNNADRLKFNLAFGTSAGAAAFLAALDVDDNGTINNADRLKFNLNFGKTLSGFIATI
jgi:hypothetical protein